MQESKLILFLSVDIVGSTLFKSANTNEQRKHQHPWLSIFEDFYRDFPTLLKKEIDDRVNDKKFTITQDARPHLWKSAGDELIFKCQILDHKSVPFILDSFKSAILRYAENLKTLNLDLKGTAWIAGVPVINAELGSEKDDYIGPSIDCGFRICKFASERKLIISLELAYMLLDIDKDADKPLFVYYFDGCQELKGVLNGKPYPIIWIDMRHGQAPREEKLQGITRANATPSELFSYCKSYIESVSDHLLVIPYIPQVYNGIPQIHQEILNNIEKEQKGSYEENPGETLEIADDNTQDKNTPFPKTNFKKVVKRASKKRTKNPPKKSKKQTRKK